MHRNAAVQPQRSAFAMSFACRFDALRELRSGKRSREKKILRSCVPGMAFGALLCVNCVRGSCANGSFEFFWLISSWHVVDFLLAGLVRGCVKTFGIGVLIKKMRKVCDVFLECGFGTLLQLPFGVLRQEEEMRKFCVDGMGIWRGINCIRGGCATRTCENFALMHGVQGRMRKFCIDVSWHAGLARCCE